MKPVYCPFCKIIWVLERKNLYISTVDWKELAGVEGKYDRPLFNMECSEFERVWSVRLKMSSPFFLSSSVMDGVQSFLLDPCLHLQVFLPGCGISADGLVCGLGLPPTPWHPNQSQSYIQMCKSPRSRKDIHWISLVFCSWEQKNSCLSMDHRCYLCSPNLRRCRSLIHLPYFWK